MSVLTSVFVEGITDVRIYKTILAKLFQCNPLEAEEESRLKELFQSKRLSDVLFPRQNVIYMNCQDRLVILKGQGGVDKLLGLLESIRIQDLRRLKRQIEKNKIVYNDWTFDKFELWFIFDEDVRENATRFERIRKVLSSDVVKNGMFIRFQKTPENLVIENFKKVYPPDSGEVKLFDELPPMYERYIGDFGPKRQFYVIKSMIGLGCYDQLFENLIGRMPHGRRSEFVPEWLNEFFQ